MGHDTVRCDTCGAVSPNPSRDGMTCNASAPGGGYCQGTMHSPAWHAEQKAAERKGLEMVLGTSAQEFAAEAKPKKGKK